MSKPVKGPATLTPFVDELPLPQVLYAGIDEINANSSPRLRISMNHFDVQLHSALPVTRVWGYNKQTPGPTIEVRCGQSLRIEWVNTIIESPLQAPVLAENLPFIDSANINTYTNEQRATTLWYHDVGLQSSHYNRYAGLAGFWIIRDAEDDAISTALNKYELPLLIQDRNLETDANGYLTGQLLYADTNNSREFFGPYTLVNGKIWPYAEIQARPYRLRLLNGSNSHVYRLLFLDENANPHNDAIQQIGNDAGLLRQPRRFAASDGLLLTPSQRLDILVDFSGFRGKHIRLVNTAAALFHAPDLQNVNSDQAATDTQMPFPNVMEFRVNANQSGKSFATLKLPYPLSAFTD